MKKAYRIGYWRYYEDAEFEALLRFLKRYKDCVDELALFTEYSHHGYYPLSYFQDLCQVLKRRIPALRELGIPSVGLNVLDTLGHIDEAWDVWGEPPLERMMGHDGRVSRSCLCPNGAGYQQYIQEKYKLLAETGPDFIWVDDDIRMHHHTVDYACFCPRCIERFNQRNHTTYDREKLVQMLNSLEGERERRAWLDWNCHTITELMKWIGSSVSEISPTIRLGLMTSGIVWGNYSNPEYGQWMETLGASMARPGGGFSNDDEPLDIVRKIHECARQIALYPKEISDIQYELENFPYQRLSKSVAMVILECTASLAAGHSGIAFNAISSGDYPELMEAVRQYSAMWDTMERLARGFVPGGLYPCFNLAYAAKRRVDGNWFSFQAAQKVDQAYEWNKIGIPLTMRPEGACANLLIGSMPEAYEEEALKKILAQGAIMDGQALSILAQRGLDKFCGVKIIKTVDNGVYERIYDHPFNGMAAGSKRDPYITFWGEDSKCYVLEKTDEAVQFISGLETICGTPAGPCMSLYENSLGGRIAVMGIMPWKFVGSPEKRYQLQAVCSWVSRGQMPVSIRECVKVIPFIAYAEDGSSALLVLINGSLDETGPFALDVNVKNAAGAYQIGQDGLLRPLLFQVDQETGRARMELNSMKAWEFSVLYLTKEPLGRCGNDF